MRESSSDFEPILGFKNPHFQTLCSYYIKRFKEPLSTLHFVDLEDGDKIALEVTTPPNWKKDDPTILLMHGVGGSSKSPYLIRMAHKLQLQNFQAIRMNFRGIGPGAGEAQHTSHGGSSDDLYSAIKYINKIYPDSPLIVIGFSLSGNILLKLAGENSSLPEVEKIIAVCPSLNLKDSSLKLEKFQNRLYQGSILNSLIDIVESPESKFSFKPEKPLRSCKTLREFDELFTAPSRGFLSADDYYEQCSSIHIIENINKPCHILLADDDPLIDSKAILTKKLPPNIEVKITKHGGHMGYVTYPKNKDPFWMDTQLLYWIQKDL